MNTADANESQVILANDPDADRLAIAEKQPRSANQNACRMNCVGHSFKKVLFKVRFYICM